MNRFLFLGSILLACNLLGGFALEFAKNPVENYRKLQQRRASGGVNFQFPELDGIFSYLSQFAEQELIAIENKALNASDRGCRTGMMNSLLQQAKELRQKKYPYAKSILAIHDFLEQLNYYFSKEHYKNIAIYTFHGWSTILDKIRDPQVILIPTEDELAPSYFIDTQSVRVYALGVSVKPFIEADGRKMSPLDFFLHDGDHIGLCEQAFLRAPGRDDEKMDRLQNNKSYIIEQLHHLADENIFKASELLLFECFHEGAVVKCDFAAVKHRLTYRFLNSTQQIDVGCLADRVQEHIENGFYDASKKELIPYLHKAKDNLLNLIEHAPCEESL